MLRLGLAFTERFALPLLALASTAIAGAVCSMSGCKRGSEARGDSFRIDQQAGYNLNNAFKSVEGCNNYTFFKHIVVQDPKEHLKILERYKDQFDKFNLIFRTGRIPTSQDKEELITPITDISALKVAVGSAKVAAGSASVLYFPNDDPAIDRFVVSSALEFLGWLRDQPPPAPACRDEDYKASTPTARQTLCQLRQDWDTKEIPFYVDFRLFKCVTPTGQTVTKVITPLDKDVVRAYGVSPTEINPPQ